jgi:glycosyltransferase involved in cell wall biosynthesis
MRIAQVAPLFESVPPKSYGGTERVVSYLTEALVAAGHEVTLFASGDSITRAELVPCCARSLRTDHACMDQMAHQVRELELVFQRAGDFDLIHFHNDFIHFPLSRRSRIPHVTTLHGRLDIPDLLPLYREFAEVPVISISNAQRRPLPWLNWRGTVYHGLPTSLYALGDGRGGYLAFLGRISHEKRVDRAVLIARRLGLRLRVAAKVEKAEQDYYDRVAPLLRDPLVEFVGEIGEAEKAEFLGGALALLFPIDWPEPFGLAMIEAMACGTPVVAFRRGSVPEVVDDGVTGFVVDSIEEAAQAVERAAGLSRRRCRETFERRFSTPAMLRRYLGLYDDLLGLDRRPAERVPERGVFPSAALS